MVVVPTNALIVDQVRKLKEKGVCVVANKDIGTGIPTVLSIVALLLDAKTASFTLKLNTEAIYVL